MEIKDLDDGGKCMGIFVVALARMEFIGLIKITGASQQNEVAKHMNNIFIDFTSLC